MYFKWVLVCGLLIGGSWCEEQDRFKFPPWFKFGAATAAYQVEGAWNVSDKAESIWDRAVHTHPELIADRSNADVTCDSYHLWRRDIEMAEELGLQMYRFSISWPRLLPTGFSNYISEDGKNYYNNLINGLLEKGIEPLVTLYHWDLPQSLQDLGGWFNPLIIDWFSDYARVVFTLFGDRVKIWITINEPIVVCDGAYFFGAPFLELSKVGMYTCNKNILIAHAKAYRIYDEEFRPKYDGKVSIANLFLWFEPESPADEEATLLVTQMWEGRYAHAIYSDKGGWPPELEQYLADKSIKEGYKKPFLPPFTDEEIELVKGSSDFYAFHHYFTRLIRKVPEEEAGAWMLYGSEEIGVQFVSDPSWEANGLDFFTIVPEKLRDQLHWIQNTYPSVKEIIITENGINSQEADLFDWRRLSYLRRLLEQILFAINDGVNITGYTFWCLMDDFEWVDGYTQKFGLYAVNFTDENRTRTPRESARYYSKVTRTRSPYHT